MKCRSNFVSNSSSSSFIISGISANDLRLFLERILEAYSIIGKSYGSVDNILYITEIDDLDEIRLKNHNHCNKNKITLEQFKLMNKSTEKVSGIEVNSCYDNSIPWAIQDMLSEIGERFHWG